MSSKKEKSTGTGNRLVDFDTIFVNGVMESGMVDKQDADRGTLHHYSGKDIPVVRLKRWKTVWTTECAEEQ